MKTSLTMLAMVFTLTLTAYAADPPPPPCEDCPTNEPPVITPQVFPPDSLLVGIAGSALTLTNGDLWSDYVFQHSPDLLTWTNYSPRFEVGTNSAIALSITIIPGYYRAADDTLTVYDQPSVTTGFTDCGTYNGYSSYNSAAGGAWGYYFDTNMSRHAAVDPGSNVVFFLGHFGDFGCATNIVVPSGASDSYRYNIMFAATVPTNPYPIRLKGHLE